MILRPATRRISYCFLFFFFATYIQQSSASLGDHLPDFRSCVKVHIQISEACMRKDLMKDRYAKVKIVKMGTRPYVSFSQ